MMDRKQLERLALIGTAQLQEEIDMPAGFDPPAGDPDRLSRKLLIAAGTNSLMHKAGSVPLTANAFPKWEPAQKETTPALGPNGIESLNGIVTVADQQLLEYYLLLLDQHRRRIPARYIIPLMRLAAGQRNLARRILALSGARGSWLAKHGSEWRDLLYSESVDNDTWGTGDIGSRAAHFGELRKKDPAAGRALFEQAVASSSAKELVVLMNELVHGLSQQDAPVLEPLLLSKSKEVRAAAAALLARIPDHALVRTLFGIAAPFIQLKGNMLLGRKLEVELPVSHQKEWQALGIAPKHARFPTDRTAWLGQMIAMVPPRLWYDHFSRNADELVGLAMKNEFNTTLLAAFTDAALLHMDLPMIEALLQVTLKEGVEWHWQLLRSNELWAALPSSVTEAMLLPVVKRGSKGGEMEVIQLLALHQHEWSDELSKVVLEWFERVRPAPSEMAHWIHLLSQAMQRYMSPAMAALIPLLLDRSRETASPAYIKALEKLGARLRLRQRMMASLNEPPLSHE